MATAIADAQIYKIVVDGSQLEGGGQILRNATALAACRGVPIRIENIRAGRSKPGLRPQHMTGMQLVRDMCGGQLAGCEVGATTVELTPGGALRAGRFVADTKTAGSCMLMVQASLPCALLAGASLTQRSAEGSSGAAEVADFTAELELRGGTDAAMAPPFGYCQHVLLPTLRQRLGVRLEMTCRKRGFFPKGGGVVLLEVAELPTGTCLPPVTLTERGRVTSVSIEAIACGRINVAVAERMAAAAEKTLKKGVPALRQVPITSAASRPDGVDTGGTIVLVAETAEIKLVPANAKQTCAKPLVLQGDPALREVPITSTALRPEGADTGGSIVLVAETDTGCIFGASGLAERGVAAEDVGRGAAEALLEAVASGACVDEWMQDQLIVFMALANGRSQVLCGELTLHTRTAIAIAQQLTTAKFEVAKQDGGRYLVTCEGAALAAQTVPEQ